MTKNLKELFKDKQAELKSATVENIWLTISRYETRRRLITRLIYSFVGFASIIGLFITTKDLINQFSQSGFYYYTSLIFSNSSSIASHFSDFALTLADSLPTTSLIISLSLLFFFVVSLRKLSVEISKSRLLAM